MRFVAICIMLACAGLAPAATPEQHLQSIKAVAKEGAGNQEAGAAWKALIALGGDALFPALAAIDDSSPTASNWIRSAVSAIADNEKRAGRPLPADKLESYVKDTARGHQGRRLAYELLADLDPKAPDRLLPGFLNDRNDDLRRDAIAAALKTVEPLVKTKPETAKPELEKLFTASRDYAQADKIAKSLKTLGGTADLMDHFGIQAKWMVVGPFDSTNGSGFDKAYDPEAGVDLKATYKGKGGVEVKWLPVTAEDTTADQMDGGLGLVNLNKGLSKHKDAVAYAFTVVESDQERPVEVRLGSYCAVKVFLNGKPVFALEEYHHGERFDQYVVRGTLKAGKNELLVKVCQNNQSEPWAQNWRFHLRLCDATGGALPVKAALSAP